MMISEPGLYPDLADIYHSEQLTPTRCLTQSGIKVLLAETPFDYFNAPSKPQTDEMAFGSVVHALALGKGAKFAVSPFDDYRTKDARQWKAETIEAGQIPIKAEKFGEAQSIATRIQYRLSELFDGAEYQTEVPFFWQEGNTWCGGMADVWCPEWLCAVDIKLTASVGMRAPAHMINQGWDIQAAWYRRGLSRIMPQDAGRIRFVNLLIKPDAPYTSRLIMMNEAWRTSAENECFRALRIFDRCMASGEWPGYDGIEELDAPAWALGQRMMAEMMEGEQ